MVFVIFNGVLFVGVFLWGLVSFWGFSGGSLIHVGSHEFVPFFSRALVRLMGSVSFGGLSWFLVASRVFSTFFGGWVGYGGF